MDVLNFFISKHAYPGKSKRALNFTQRIDGQNSFTIKNTHGIYEWHSWDDHWVYLRQDTSVGKIPMKGDFATSYRLTGGLWLPRFADVGDYVEVNPRVDWYNSRCVKINTWTTWKYYIFIETVQRFNIGGDIGWQNCLVLKFDYYSAYEKFYYSDEWGWVRWEYWEGKTKKETVNINKFSKPFKLELICGAPK